ncbi:MAG: TolC family protein [Planctomycetota bacterium]
MKRTAITTQILSPRGALAVRSGKKTLIGRVLPKRVLNTRLLLASMLSAWVCSSHPMADEPDSFRDFLRRATRPAAFRLPPQDATSDDSLPKPAEGPGVLQSPNPNLQSVEAVDVKQDRLGDNGLIEGDNGRRVGDRVLSPEEARERLRKQREAAGLPPLLSPDEIDDSEIVPAEVDDSSVSGLEMRIPEVTDAMGEEPPLQLADVVASLYRAYPAIQQARLQANVANGLYVEAFGAFDTKFKAESLNEPTGFYENYRNGLGLARQTWWGTQLGAGYRIGRGTFQPWYKERQTDDAGEFKVTVLQPLLRGRAFDPERYAVFSAALQRQGVEPGIRLAVLGTSGQAIVVYWDWVQAGAVVDAQMRLLTLAEDRNRAFEVGVRAGGFAEVDLLLNQQLIRERASEVLKARQKLRDVTFKLALFLRDANGQPMIPSITWLPGGFPDLPPEQRGRWEDDLAIALVQRPELDLLQLEARQVQLDRRLAGNDFLPNFDLIAEASQDMGEPSSSSDDKGEFELVLGFVSEVPIQRRKALGKLQSTAGKLAQIEQKQRLTRDKIANELQIARNRLEKAREIYQQAAEAFRLSQDVLARFEFAFEAGQTDLIKLNIQETKATELEIKLIEASRNWYIALGGLQLAMALDPLEQASALASMPRPNERPNQKLIEDQDFSAMGEDAAAEYAEDWKKHDEAMKNMQERLEQMRQERARMRAEREKAEREAENLDADDRAAEPLEADDR